MCNLLKTVHYKWLQSSRGKITNIDQVILDDYTLAFLELFFFFNYLKDGPSGTRPNKSELQLCLATQIGNSKRVVKLIEQVTRDARVNTKVLHLEGETIFGSMKRKLNLPAATDSDSHHHDYVNYLIPKLGRGMSLAQLHNSLEVCMLVAHYLSLWRSYGFSSPSYKLLVSPKQCANFGCLLF